MGASTQAKINRPDTAHGKLDMPFESTKSKGGNMKAEKKSGKKPFFLFKKKDEEKTPKFAKGGGIESRGKTKGTMVKMAKGGRAC
jgi:hypothetical protein